MKVPAFLLALLLTCSLSAQTNCHIFDLTATVVDCANGQFYAVLHFQHENTGNDGYKIQGNGVQYGTFPYSQIPVTIGPLPANGTTNYEFVVKDVQFPDCKTFINLGAVTCPTTGGDCEIFDVSVQTGDCHPDSTFSLTLNFEVANTTNNLFDVWAGNGQYIGHWPLSSLPLQIEHFPWYGAFEVIKICINDNPNCCKIKEFAAPPCVNTHPCEIYDLVVETGECNNDGTYQAWINFHTQNPGNAFFEVWAGAQYIGYFPLTSLPLQIPHFPHDGGVNDVVKVCINDQPNCCKIKEFAAPACANPHPCEIYDLVVETGDCNNDGTYQAWINFQTQNPGSAFFKVWAGSQYIGYFPLASLPLQIPNFPHDGGVNDAVKVCISDQPDCCKIKEFAAPDCANVDPCKIWDLAVMHTPCLCGQFFAVLTFNHQNGGNNGFDVVGNGHNYGNFPYSNPQPLILGPLSGDSTTMYEFRISDHNHPDCHDYVTLGQVSCANALSGVHPVSMTQGVNISPNPAGDFIHVAAQKRGGGAIGQSTVAVYQASGKLLRTETVEDGGNCTLNVEVLPQGAYHLRISTNFGVFEGNFVKM